MPTLIVEHDGRRFGGALAGRVLIGRLPTHGVSLPDSGVSRLHAWIDPADDGFVLTDAGSLTGTFVNGELLSAPHPLAHGDRIVIGKGQLFYRSPSRLPEGVVESSLAGRQSRAPQKTGVVFDCACGAPLWARWEEIGRPLQCRHCKQVVIVPTVQQAVAGVRASLAPQSQSAAYAQVGGGSDAGRVHFGADDDDARAGAGATAVAEAPAYSPAIDARTCSICQSALADSDARTSCPECGLVFHADCWRENYGCSAYGCSQVNVLRPAEVSGQHVLADEESASWGDSVDENADAARVPWEYVLLGASVIGALVGAMTFGAPAALAAVFAIGYALRNRGKRRAGVAMLAGAIGVAGVLVGLATSWFLWYGTPIWKHLLR